MLLLPVLLIFLLGFAVIFSSSPDLALQQLAFASVGLIIFFFLRTFDYRSLKVLIKPAYIFIIITLTITFIIGFETRGSVRWIPLGLFNFQPSEFAKPVLILALAAFWTKNTPSWKNIFKSFLIILPIAAFVFKQPDLGTTLTLVFIWLCMLWASHISMLKVSILSAIAAIMIPTSWFFLHDYQKQRIYSFLSPTNDPQGIGFHVIQSMIAVGSGEIFGRGLGRGTQSRLQFLPEFRTDFIFAFISEELGFLGAFTIILLYGFLFFLLLRSLSLVRDRFGDLIIIGTIGMLIFQVVVNMGMNLGLLPITGITLPLLSYGGSSIITTFICLGFVASIQRYSSKREDVLTIKETVSFLN